MSLKVTRLSLLLPGGVREGFLLWRKDRQEIVATNPSAYALICANGETKYIRLTSAYDVSINFEGIEKNVLCSLYVSVSLLC